MSFPADHGTPAPPLPLAAGLGGRTVVVTGGNGGIGLGLALGAAKAGARVAVWARYEHKNDEAIRKLRGCGATAVAIPCDVRDPEGRPGP